MGHLWMLLWIKVHYNQNTFIVLNVTCRFELMTHRFADNALIHCATLLGNPDYYLKCLQKE